MASLGNHGAAARKHLRVLLPFTCDSLRIPDELAEEIGAAEALVVGPPGVKVWPVQVGWDGDGAFLGHGWPEFADACGVDAGWLVVLRHRGRGVLTVKAFDASCFLTELGTSPAAQTTIRRKGASCTLQFITMLPLDSMGKMLIPSKFVQHYCSEEHLNNHMAIVIGPLGKIAQIELEMNRLDVFFAGGWSHFLAFHDITEANALLLRYEGNMVFTIKVFEPDGCQRESKHKDIRMQQISTLPDSEEPQEASSASFQNSRKNNWPSSDGEKKPKGFMTFLNKASLRRRCVYNIGPPSWIKKHMNTKTIKRHISLPATFCNAIGFQEACTVTLKTSLSSTRSWQTRLLPFKNTGHQFGSGWSRFCRENGIKEGDICTFYVVETTLWHVVIEHQ